MTGRLQRHYLDRPWGRLCYWQAGEGPVLIALHGLGGSGRYWSGLARELGGREGAASKGPRWTVVAPDHGGFGHSDKPAVEYDRAFHVENIDALVQHVAANARVTVVGHSLGGALAALWMAGRPERVRAAALVAAPFPGAMTMPGRDRATYDMDQRASWQRVYRAAQVAWPVITFPVRSRTFPHPVIADFMSHTLASYWGTAQSVLWDPSAADETSGLSALGAPLLVLSAADDRSVPAGAAERWAMLVPAAQRLTVPGGHQLLFRGGLSTLMRWLDNHA